MFIILIQCTLTQLIIVITDQVKPKYIPLLDVPSLLAVRYLGCLYSHVLLFI